MSLRLLELVSQMSQMSRARCPTDKLDDASNIRSRDSMSPCCERDVIDLHTNDSNHCRLFACVVRFVLWSSVFTTFPCT